MHTMYVPSQIAPADPKGYMCIILVTQQNGNFNRQHSKSQLVVSDERRKCPRYRILVAVGTAHMHICVTTIAPVVAGYSGLMYCLYGVECTISDL